MSGLLNMLGFGRLTSTDDTADLQTMDITQGATGSTSMVDRLLTKIIRFGQFGLSVVPPDDSEVMMVRMNGERAKSFVIGASHRPSRPRNLKPGDTVLYDVRGRMVRLTADGIEVDGAGGPVTVKNATKVRCECDVQTTGDVVSRCDGVPVSLNALRDAYDLHNHPPLPGTTSWGTGPPNKQV